MKRLTMMLMVVTLVWGQNWQPVYELFNPSLGDHFYTMNMAEVTQAENNMGYTNHGPKYKWSSSSYGTGVPVYRLWHDSDHFYTTSIAERDNCIANGYVDEGIVGYINSGATGNLVAWYRYYHAQWDDHAYPVDQADIDVLVNAGYFSEGVHGYVMPLSDDEIPLEPPNSSWTGDLYSEYNYEEISFTWQGTDANDDASDLWYHIQLSGNGSFDFWTPDNYLNCWPGVGDHTLTITARDLDNMLDPTPLVHNFTTIGRSPDPPSNLSAVINSDESIILSWESNDDIVIGFTIWRDYDTELANLPSDSRSYEDDDVEIGEVYRYVVVAYSHYGWTESQPLFVEMANTINNRAERFDFPVGYPDFGGDWYDAQNFGSVLADPTLFHSGNDLNKLSGDYGEPIYAPADGVIVYKNNDAAGWGRCMITKHQAEDNSYFVFPDGSLHSYAYFMYAHLSEIISYDDIVVNETAVNRGEQIASLGNSGSATGPHLHIECWFNMPDGYPLGYGYYDELPTDKYDVMEFISTNRMVGNSYDLYVHNYNQTFSVQTDGWNIIPGAQELQWLPLGYNNYLYATETDQDEIACWDLNIALIGNYELSIFIPNQHYSSQNAHYVLCRSGYDDVEFFVDGSIYSNEWFSVGDYEFTANTDNYLLLYSQTSESPAQEVVADAVWLHYLDDIGGTVGIDEVTVPTNFNLIGYPNPFNDNIRLSFDLPSNQMIDLSIYNILGQRVCKLTSGYYQAGAHQINWQAQDVASGIYLVVLQTPNQTKTMKVNYLR